MLPRLLTSSLSLSLPCCYHCTAAPLSLSLPHRDSSSLTPLLSSPQLLVAATSTVERLHHTTEPITLALVYAGTTLKDLSNITHGWHEISPSRWLLERKIQEAKSKKDTLKARAQSARTATKVSEMVGKVNIMEKI